MQTFVRFQSVIPNRRGTHPGVFALANGLASNGLLSPPDALWHRAANDRANAMYADPTVTSPACYDPSVNAGARSWFKSAATELLDMTRGYLTLLDRYGIGWTELRTNDPGRITYEEASRSWPSPAPAPGSRTRPTFANNAEHRPRSRTWAAARRPAKLPPVAHTRAGFAHSAHVSQQRRT